VDEQQLWTNLTDAADVFFGSFLDAGLPPLISCSASCPSLSYITLNL
jgi:hypothetical protein